MEIDTKRLTPGMVLKQDVIGKSGKPIIAKNTKLTEVHIEFIEKFLIETVSVFPLFKSKQKQVHDHHPVIEQKDSYFLDDFEKVVIQYKKLFLSWKNNVPIEMYNIRTLCVPLFEKVMKQNFETVINVMRNHLVSDRFYYKSAATSLLAIFLANKLNYEKKDWFQIGFAALLSDVGFAKMDSSVLNGKNDSAIKDFEMHPLYSYKMVENVMTLTQQAKMAILQHHERLDGSGYPAKTDSGKIHPFAKIIAVSDFFYSNYEEDTLAIIHLLEEQHEKLDETIVKKLINELKK